MLSGVALVAVAILIAISVDFGLPGQGLLGSLRFHIGLAMLLLPLALVLAGARLRGLVMLGIVGLSLAQGAGIVLIQQQRRDPLEARTPVASLHVVSFNVLTGNPKGADAAAYIAASNADIALALEAPGIAAHLPALRAQFPHMIGCDNVANCDMVLMSRTPFLVQRQFSLWPLDRWRLTQGTIEVDGHTLTVVAIHLTKPYFDGAAAAELQQARRLIAEIEGPVLLMGDFNGAAWSNDIADFASDLELLPPPSYPATWPVKLGPLGVPIDNMFTRGPALIREIERTPSNFGSNHMGLVARVDLF